MNAYIELCKNNFQNKVADECMTVVLGNESCDLDSAVSSLVFAYFLHCSSKNENLNEKSRLYIPFLNIIKDDLAIKTEVVYSLKKYNINIDNLLFIRDGNFQPVKDLLGNKLKVVLVDHHILDEELSYLIENVNKILDHRPKDTIMWKYSDNIKSNIINVGSCATLVCAEILSAENGKDFLSENIDAASLLYETIVLDTVNFSPSADRAKPMDFETAAELEDILDIKDPDTHRKNIFENLVAARSDYSSLNSNQLLRKDLKVVNNVPVPGLPLLVIDFLKRGDINKSLKNFCSQYATSTMVIVGLVVVNYQVQRDIAVFTSNNKELSNKICEALVNAVDPSLQLERISSNIENCVYFRQLNTKATRKHIIPILKSVTK